jgi:hypothetical protein
MCGGAARADRRHRKRCLSAAKLRDEIKELRRELAAAETTAAAEAAAAPLSARLTSPRS